MLFTLVFSALGTGLDINRTDVWHFLHKCVGKASGNPTREFPWFLPPPKTAWDTFKFTSSSLGLLKSHYVTIIFFSCWVLWSLLVYNSHLHVPAKLSSLRVSSWGPLLPHLTVVRVTVPTEIEHHGLKTSSPQLSVHHHHLSSSRLLLCTWPSYLASLDPWCCLVGKQAFSYIVDGNENGTNEPLDSGYLRTSERTHVALFICRELV